MDEQPDLFEASPDALPVQESAEPPAEAEPTEASPEPEAPATEESPAVALAESFNHAILLEASDKEGGLWEVCVVEEGKSLNGNVYTAEALKGSGAAAFDGASVFAYELQRGLFDHLPENVKAKVGDGAGLLRNLVGTLEGVTYGEKAGKRGLFGKLRVIAPWAKELLRAAWDAGKGALLGFSIDARARTEAMPDGSAQVLEFAPNPTLDVVSHPAAGGELLRLVASLQGEPEAEELPEEQTKESEMSDQIVEQGDALFQKLELRQSCRETITDRLADSGLPAAAQRKLRDSLKAATFESIEEAAAAVDAAVTAERDYIALIAPAPEVRESGDTRGEVEQGEDHSDKVQKGLDGFFARKDLGGVARFRGLHEAFYHVTGKLPGVTCPVTDVLSMGRRYIGTAQEDVWGSARESVGSLGDGFRRVQEATTATWGQVLGDSITRSMIAEYNQPSLQDWRKICSEVSAVRDFRTQRRTHLGQFANLATVAEGAVYVDAVDLVDTEETFTLTKRGNTYPLTMELLANDDVGVIRALPGKMGRAAAQTLYTAFFDTLTTNPVMGEDGNAIFHAAHNNTAARTLSGENLRLARVAMMDQPAYGGAAQLLGFSNIPKYLIVPNELADLAWTLVNSAVALSEPVGGANPDDFQSTVPNVTYNRTMEVIVVPHWTSAVDWYVAADPQATPCMEVGFLGGKEEPELFTRDDEAGDPTNNLADSIDLKIRHIYGIKCLDYRSMFRNDT